MGIGAILPGIPRQVAVGIALPIESERPNGNWVTCNGRRYYYAEATPHGDWLLGQMPEKFRNKMKPITIKHPNKPKEPPPQTE